MKYSLVNFCEFDKFAVKSYCAIHGTDETLNLGDITKVDETEIDAFNVICGGSPCQDFSLAGKQGGSVWKCKHCGETYNPLEYITAKETGVQNAVLKNWIRHVPPCWSSGCG